MKKGTVYLASDGRHIEAKPKIDPLFVLNLNHFKQINDQHGHLVGDQVLREFACMLTEWVRKSDIVARFGGEEFLILLPRCDQELAMEVAERIVQQTRVP